MWVPYALLIGIVFFLAVWERVRPAQALPLVSGWRRRAWPLNLMMIPIILLAGWLWEPWFKTHSVLNAHTLPPLLGGLLAYLTYQLALYGWHRLKHASDLIWRLQHQIHHSPTRIELLTAFYAHPLEALLNVLLVGAVIYGLLGVSIEAAAWFTAFEVALDALAHANIRTPHVLGLIVQRPEMHRLHHQTGVHAGNYGLPLWDRMFGTWRNPRQDIVTCGFTQQREERLGEMLRGVDVHRPTTRRCCRFLFA